MQHGAESKALHSWRDYSARRAQLRGLMETLSGRVSGSRLASCLRAWRQVGWLGGHGHSTRCASRLAAPCCRWL
jgi:hypothetical protein